MFDCVHLSSFAIVFHIHISISFLSYVETHSRSFSKYRLKNSFSKLAVNHHDVLDIKYSMEEINEFIGYHFSYIVTSPVQYYVYGYQCFICFAFVKGLWYSFTLPGFSGREASWLYIGV